jgi:methyl-accepting chemotaxis protein
MLFSYLVSLLLVIIAFIFAIRMAFARLSHPLTQIAADLRRMREGELNLRITLRHHDEFKDFAELLNAMADQTGERFVRIAAHAHQLTELAVIKPEQDVEELAARLDHHVSFIEKEIGSFKR